MATPQTHLVVTGVIRIILLFIFNVKFTFWELPLFYFWGVLVDFDHFTSKEYVKDLARRRKNLKEGKDAGPPAEGIKMPLEIFHMWPAIPIMLLFLPLFLAVSDFNLKSGLMRWSIVVFLPWFVHYWVIDRFQKNYGRNCPYLSFLYPVLPKWERKWGYPIKSRVEIKIFNRLAVLIILFEVVWYFFIR